MCVIAITCAIYGIADRQQYYMYIEVVRRMGCSCIYIHRGSIKLLMTEEI